MKRILLPLLALFFSLCTHAYELMLNDFNSNEKGDVYELVNITGGEVSPSTAVVTFPPTNRTERSLRVTTKTWNTFVKFELPAELQGNALIEKYQQIEFDIYRAKSMTNDYMQMAAVMIGTENQNLYWDEGYPFQDNKGKWEHKVLVFNTNATLTGNAIVLGIHSDDADYYIDNVKLVGTETTVIDNGDKVTFTEDQPEMLLHLKNGSAWSGSVSLTKPFGKKVTVDKGELHFSFNNSSSEYASIDVPVILNDNAVLSVYTSRYTYWTSQVSGNGTVNFYGGGERAFTGTAKNASFPNWSEFTGRVNVLPYKEVFGSAGFYGLVLNCNKTFYPDDVEGGIKEGKYNNMFEQATLNITNGATLANENGNRAFRIAHLDLQEGSHLKGYYKSSTAKSFYIVGSDNTNSTLYGKILPESGNLLGLIKEGKGTYTIAGKQNSITGGVRVMEGTVYVDGTTGAATSGAVITVCPSALAGGTGNIGGIADIYGNLRAGNSAIGTLTIAKDLIVRPTAQILFRVGNDANDKLNITGNVKYDSKCFDFTTSELSPVIRPVIASDFNYTAGAEYVLLKAKALTGNDAANGYFFRVANPDKSKWNIVEKTEDGVYSVILKAEASTSANDLSDEEIENLDNPADDDSDDDDIDFSKEDFTDRGDNTSLRAYAEKVGKKIGVAVPVYKMNISNSSDPRTKAIYENFNLCVAENEMKIDALQPSQGSFTFGNADQLVNFAQRNNMRVRGHTLVWHQQVPSWISSDGKKNDKNWTRQQALDIMKNHITTVMTHFKGKVYEWDVVNEMLDDDQSIVRTNPDAYNLRSNVWYKAIGEDYIDSALVYAHRADPDAKLYINEYGAEMQGSAKTEAYYNLAKRLLKSGNPLDGVGLQCHLTVGELNEKKFDANVARYKDLNINCIVTELDMSIADFSDPYHYERQAEEYRKIVRTMLKYDHFPHLIVWGVTDDLSWRGGEPLLFNSSSAKKPAFWGIRNTVAEYVANDIELPIATESILPTANRQYYNLSGQRVGKDYKGIVISNGKAFINK